MTRIVKTTARKRFLSPDALAQAVSEVGAIARAADVDVIVIGGYAMQHYGSDRLTCDVDFAVSAPLAALPKGQLLKFGGVRTVAPSGVPIDVILRRDAYARLYTAAVAYSGWRRTWTTTSCGGRVWRGPTFFNPPPPPFISNVFYKQLFGALFL